VSSLLYVWIFVVDVDVGSGGPGEHLRGMAHTEFMDLIRAVYKSLLGCVQGLQTQNTIIIEVVESIQSVPSPLLSQPHLFQTLTPPTQISKIINRHPSITRRPIRRPRISR
jgi:hypothetical protein